MVKVLLACISVGPSLQISLIVVWSVVLNSSLIEEVWPSGLWASSYFWMSLIILTVVNKTTMNSLTRLQFTSGRSSNLVSAFLIDSLSLLGSSARSSPSKYFIRLLVSNWTRARMPNYACDYELLDSYLSPLKATYLESVSVFCCRKASP
jgi:hypothetical protein